MIFRYIKKIFCQIFTCKKRFNKDVKIDKSFIYDTVIISNAIVYIKGQYSINVDGKPIKEVRIKKLIINEGGWLKIQSIDTLVKIDEIIIYRGKFTVATEANNFDNGTTLNIGTITIKNANNWVLFFQNIKSGYIEKIHAINSMFNKDGTDAIHKKHGLNLLKWDNALALKNDKRSFIIKDVLIEKSNWKEKLINYKNELGSTNLNGFWLDEGCNNITFNSFISDLPMRITPGNEYYPQSTGNHYFKYLELKNRKPYMMNYIFNSKVGQLFLNETYINIKKSTVEYLNAVNTQITIDKQTIVNDSKIDDKTKIKIK